MIESFQNHPHFLSRWKNCLPQNRSLEPERLVTPAENTNATRDQATDAQACPRARLLLLSRGSYGPQQCLICP